MLRDVGLEVGAELLEKRARGPRRAVGECADAFAVHEIEGVGQGLKSVGRDAVGVFKGIYGQ